MSRVIAAWATLACLLLAPAAAGHEGMGPWIQVVDGELRQGQPFRVLGDDLDPADEVTLELAVDGGVHPLGTTTTDADGHFLAELVVPPGVPDGEAYVQLTTRAGWAASMWVHVGDGGMLRQPAAPAAGLPGPVAAAGGPAWLDPSVALLGLLVGGGLVAVGWRLWRAASPRRVRPARAGRLSAAGVQPRR